MPLRNKLSQAQALQVYASSMSEVRFDVFAQRAQETSKAKTMKTGILMVAAMLALCNDPVAAHENEGDHTLNVKTMRPLAEKGNPLAQYNLGVLYASGSGVKRDYREAVKWYRLSSAQGTALAQRQLALLYGDGKGVKQDFIRAHMWSSLAASQGNADAKKQRDLFAKRLRPAQLAEAEKLAGECEKRKYAGCD